MFRCKTKTLKSLIQHRQTIKRGLEDFARGRDMDHLSEIEVTEIVQGLNARLAFINERIANYDR